MHSIRYLMGVSSVLCRRIVVPVSLNVQKNLCTKASVVEPIVNPPAIKFTENKSNQNVPLEIDWDAEMQQILREEEEESEKNYSVLVPVNDESKIYAEPILRPSFNLAYYLPKSKTLQQLVQLGADLNNLERRKFGNFIANLDFEQNIQPYIILLTKDIGIDGDCLGHFLTQNPMILKQSLADIQVRCNYLQLKRFTKDQIVEIVSRNPFWLNFSTRRIDRRLGFFQKKFDLTGPEIRSLVLTHPKLITSGLMRVHEATFALREEFGFSKDESKQLILKCPKVFMKSRIDLVDRLDYLSYEMKIDNDRLLMEPQILETRLFRIRERHGFLESIGRAQYDPKIELYISLDALCKYTDEEFAEKVARRPYAEYDRYLRTL